MPAHQWIYTGSFMLASVHKKLNGLDFTAIYLYFSYYREKGSNVFYHCVILLTGNRISLLYKKFLSSLTLLLPWLESLLKGKVLVDFHCDILIATLDRITDTISWHQHTCLQDLLLRSCLLFYGFHPRDVWIPSSWNVSPVVIQLHWAASANSIDTKAATVTFHHSLI